MPNLTITTTHGKEQPEKATLAFIIGNNAAASDQDTAIFLMAESVWFALPGGADGVVHQGMDPLSKTLAAYLDNGGKLWVCGACAKPRGNDDSLGYEALRVDAASHSLGDQHLFIFA